MTELPRMAPGAYAIPMPVQEGEYREVIFWGRWPISPSDWDHMLHVLDTMRPGLVREPAAIDASVVGEPE